jgi:hypothetical protein
VAQPSHSDAVGALDAAVEGRGCSAVGSAAQPRPLSQLTVRAVGLAQARVDRSCRRLRFLDPTLTKCLARRCTVADMKSGGPTRRGRPPAGPTALSGLLLLYAVIVTVLWIRDIQPLAPVWGTVADWVAAATTVAALIAAVWAGHAAYGQLRHLEREAADREAASREAQARLVYVTEQKVLVAPGVPARRVIVLHNDSAEPVTRCLFSFIGPGKQNGLYVDELAPRLALPLPDASDLAEQVFAQLLVACRLSLFWVW